MVGNFQVNARAGSEVPAPLGPGGPQPRCSRRPLQEVLSGVGVQIFSVSVISVYFKLADMWTRGRRRKRGALTLTPPWT